MTTPVRKHLVTILDAPPEVQHWVDEFVAAARAGSGSWPHPHQEITLTVVPLETFDRVMAEVVGAEPWTHGGASRRGPGRTGRPDSPRGAAEPPASAGAQRAFPGSEPSRALAAGR